MKPKNSKTNAARKEKKTALNQLQDKLATDLEKWGRSLEEATKSYDLERSWVREQIDSNTKKIEEQLPKLKGQKGSSTATVETQIKKTLDVFEKNLKEKASQKEKLNQSFQKSLTQDINYLKDQFEQLQNFKEEEQARLKNQFLLNSQKLGRELTRALAKKEASLLSFKSSIEGDLKGLHRLVQDYSTSSEDARERIQTAVDGEISKLKESIRGVQEARKQDQEWIRNKFEESIRDLTRELNQISEKYSNALFDLQRQLEKISRQNEQSFLDIESSRRIDSARITKISQEIHEHKKETLDKIEDTIDKKITRLDEQIHSEKKRVHDLSQEVLDHKKDTINKIEDTLDKRFTKLDEQIDIGKKRVNELSQEVHEHKKETLDKIQDTVEKRVSKLDGQVYSDKKRIEDIYEELAHYEKNTKQIIDSFIEKKALKLEDLLDKGQIKTKAEMTSFQASVLRDTHNFKKAFERLQVEHKKDSLWIQDQLRVESSKLNSQFSTFSNKYEHIATSLTTKLKTDLEEFEKRLKSQQLNAETAMSLLNNTVTVDLNSVKKQLKELQDFKDGDRVWIREQIQIAHRKTTDQLENFNVQTNQKLSFAEAALQTEITNLGNRLENISTWSENTHREIRETAQKEFEDVKTKFQADFEVLKSRLKEIEEAKSQERQWMTAKVEESASNLRDHFIFASDKNEQAIAKMENVVQQNFGQLDNRIRVLVTSTDENRGKLRQILNEDLEGLRESLKQLKAQEAGNQTWVQDQVREATNYLREHAENLYTESGSSLDQLEARIQKDLRALSDGLKSQEHSSTHALNLTRASLIDNIKEIRNQFESLKASQDSDQSQLEEQILANIQSAESKFQEIAESNAQKIDLLDSILEEKLKELNHRFEAQTSTTYTEISRVDETLRDDLLALRNELVQMSGQLANIRETRSQDLKTVSEKIQNEVNSLQLQLTEQTNENQQTRAEFENSVKASLETLRGHLKDFASSSDQKIEQVHVSLRTDLERLKENVTGIQNTYAADQIKLDQRIKGMGLETQRQLNQLSEKVAQEKADSEAQLEARIQKDLRALSDGLKSQEHSSTHALNLTRASLIDNIKEIRNQFESLKASQDSDQSQLEEQILANIQSAESKFQEIAESNTQKIDLLDSILEEKLKEIDHRFDTQSDSSQMEISRFEEALRADLLALRNDLSQLSGQLLQVRDARNQDLNSITERIQSEVHSLQLQLTEQTNENQQTRAEFENSVKASLETLRGHLKDFASSSDQKIEQAHTALLSDFEKLKDNMAGIQNTYAADQIKLDQRIKGMGLETQRQLNQLTDQVAQEKADSEAQIESRFLNLEAEIKALHEKARDALGSFKPQEMVANPDLLAQVHQLSEKLKEAQLKGQTDQELFGGRIEQLSQELDKTGTELRREQSLAKENYESFIRSSEQNLKLLRDDIEHKVQSAKQNYQNLQKANIPTENLQAKREYLITQVKDLSIHFQSELAKLRLEQNETIKNFEALSSASRQNLTALKLEITDNIQQLRERFGVKTWKPETTEIKGILEKLEKRISHLNGELNELVVNHQKERLENEKNLNDHSKRNEESLNVLKHSLSYEIKKAREQLADVQGKQREERNLLQGQFQNKVGGLEQKTDAAITNMQMDLEKIESRLSDKISKIEKFLVKLSGRVPFGESTAAREALSSDKKAGPGIFFSILEFVSRVVALGFKVLGGIKKGFARMFSTPKIYIQTFVILAISGLLYWVIASFIREPTNHPVTQTTRVQQTIPRTFGYPTKPQTTVAIPEQDVSLSRQDALIRDLGNRIKEDGNRDAFEHLRKMVARGEGSAAETKFAEVTKVLMVTDPLMGHILLHEKPSGEKMRNRNIPAADLLGILEKSSNWKDRAKAARYLGFWKSNDVLKALAKAAKDDKNVYVVKESLRSFQRLAGVEFANPLDARQAEAWFQLQ